MSARERLRVVGEAEPARPVPIEDKIDCVRREIGRREALAAAPSPADDRDLETMRSVLATLEGIRDVIEALRRLPPAS